MLGCELWTENFESMFALVKEYITEKSIKYKVPEQLFLFTSLGLKKKAV